MTRISEETVTPLSYYLDPLGEFDHIKKPGLKETDPDEVLKLRKETIGYWNAHKSYNKAMINNGIMIGTVWAINAIHAYVAGPRPQNFIHGPEPYRR